MGVFLRQSYNVKPLRWGSPADIEYAIKVNAEKIYDVDPDSIVLAMPLFWGLPCLDYSGKRNDGVNHGAYYKDGELEFVSNDYVSIEDSPELNFGIEDFTLSATVKTNSLDTYQTIVAKDFYNDAYQWRIEVTSGVQQIYIGGSNEIGVTGLQIGSLYSLAFTRANGWGQLYLNGAIDGSSVSMPFDINNIYALLIGARRALQHPFNGNIDEVCISSNATRTVDQIALFYALPYGLYQPVVRPIYSFITGIPVFMHHLNQMRAA